MVIDACASGQTRVSGHGLDSEDRAMLERLLDRTQVPPTDIRIKDLIPRHVGLGSGTLLAMGVLAAVNHLQGLRLSRDEISAMSERGGASGIGWHAFWRGGFIVDSGQPNICQSLLPSGSSRPLECPPLTAHLPVPSSWLFTLLLQSSELRVSGIRERTFFEQNTPTPARECLLAFAALYHAIVPAVATNNIGLLREGLCRYQSLGLKRLEIAYHGPPLRGLLDAINTVDGCAYGMSSLGPLVFTISDVRDASTTSAINDIATKFGITPISVGGRNFGHHLNGEISCRVTRQSGNGR
jgi:beta-ribofuranosylaminobenzene 5'-phosphate synthase